MLSPTSLGQSLIAQVQYVELVAGVPSHADDTNGLGRYVRFCRLTLRRFAAEITSRAVGRCRPATRLEASVDRFDDEWWLAGLVRIDLDLHSAAAQPEHVVVISRPRPDEAFDY